MHFRPRKKSQREALAVFSLTPEQIEAMQAQFAQDKARWQAQFPSKLKEASRLGKSLTTVCKTRSIGDVVIEQTLSYGFERIPITPKGERRICGAKTRTGAPCVAHVCIRADGTEAKRCRLHGGLSTGPKTKEGRAAIGEANRARTPKT